MGACLCEGVRYALTPPLRDVMVCHCSLCRRTHGGAAPYTSVPRARFRLVSDETLRWYRDANGRDRGFCDRCGASLFWSAEGSASISVSAGTLSEGAGLTTSGHIFVVSADDWEVLPDLPRHAAGETSDLL